MQPLKETKETTLYQSKQVLDVSNFFTMQANVKYVFMEKKQENKF
jgi:hypothetical protein